MLVEELESIAFYGTGISTKKNNELFHEDDDDEKGFDDFSLSIGELVAFSKLEQNDYEIEKLEYQLDLVSILNAKLKSDFKRDPSLKVEIELQTKILEGTKEQIKQEIGDLWKLKAKYIWQEREDQLIPGTCVVSILEHDLLNSNFDSLKSNHSLFQPQVRTSKNSFVIKIDKIDKSNSGWSVTRQEVDFHLLHRRLKERFPIMIDLDFPLRTQLFRKEKEIGKREGLERYLQRLLDEANICQSSILRDFLSTNYVTQPDADLGKNVKKFVQSMRKQSSAMIPFYKEQNFQSSTSKPVSATIKSNNQQPHITEDIENSLEPSQSKESFSPLNPLVDPLCRILLGVFEFKTAGDFLKRNSALILLKQAAKIQEHDSIEGYLLAYLVRLIRFWNLFLKIQRLCQ